MIEYEYSDLFYKDSVKKDWTITATKKENDVETVVAIIRNEDLLDDSIEINEKISSSDLVFGRCEASKISFTVYNLNTSLKDCTLFVQVSLNNNDPFTIGTYKVDSDTATADRYHRKIEAYDALKEINEKDISNWYNSLTFPLTLKQFRDSFFQNMGVEQEEISLCNDNLSLPRIYYTSNFLHCSDVPSTTRNGVTYSISDGNIYINGTVSITTEVNLGTPLLSDGDYMICSETERGRILNGHIKYTNGKSECSPSTNGTSFTSAGATASRLILPYGVTFENCTIHLWANSGSSAYGYVKYGESGYELGVDGNTVITAICELNGAFGHITRDNKFRYVIPKEIIEGLYPNNDIIPKDDLYPKLEEINHEIDKSYWTDVKYEDYKVKRIDSVNIKDTNDTVSATSNADGKNPLILQDNFLLSELTTEQYQSIVDNLHKVVAPIWYIPASVEMIGNPCIEVGDSIRFNTRDAIIFTYVMERTLSGIQMLTDRIESTGEEYLSEDSKSIAKQLQRLSQKTKFDLEATNAKIEYLEVNYVKVKELQAVSADIQRLSADNAVIRGEISAAEVRVNGNISAVNADLSGQITAVDAKFTNLNASNIKTGTLSVDRLNVSSLVDKFSSLSMKVYDLTVSRSLYIGGISHSAFWAKSSVLNEKGEPKEIVYLSHG